MQIWRSVSLQEARTSKKARFPTQARKADLCNCKIQDIQQSGKKISALAHALDCLADAVGLAGCEVDSGALLLCKRYSKSGSWVVSVGEIPI